MANHPFAGKTAIWDNLRSSDKRNYYHKSFLNTNRVFPSKSSPFFFIINGKIMKFQVDQLKTFYWIDREDLPEDKKMNCLWARIMHSYVLEFLSPSMVVIGISIIVITQKIQCMLSKSSPFMLRNSARLQSSVFKFLVQSRLSSPPTQTSTSSKALSWQPWKSKSQEITIIFENIIG